MFSLPVFADDSKRQQTEQQLKDVRNKIEALTRKISQNRGKKSKEEKQLRSVEKKLGKERRALHKLNTSIKQNTQRLKNLQQDLKQLNRDLKQQQVLLAEQLKAAYISGNRQQLKLLLNQEDPENVSRMTTYYDYVNKARTKQIRTTLDTLARIDQVSLEIDQKNQALYQLSEEHEKRRKSLSSQRKERQKVVDKIRQQLKSQGSHLSRLKGNEQEIETLLQSLSELLADIPDAPAARVPFSSLKGKLAWPTPGKPQNRFGSPRQQGDLKWRGVMITAPAGRNVRAVSSGRVAFADWLQGFGLLIIIDHDDGYLSLYGHNRALLKDVGDWVEKDEIISQVGDSGGLDRSALYFELRHQGKPINPRRWCKKLNG